MNIETLTRTVTLTNTRSRRINAVLEPFWCEFGVNPGDQIEFRGEGGDNNGVYLVEIVEGYVVLWEWDSSSNEVRLNGNLVSDWSTPSPSLWGDWEKRQEEEHGRSKTVFELIRTAREKESSDNSCSDAHVDNALYPFTGVCLVHAELPDVILSNRGTQTTLTMNPDLWYIVEIKTKLPSPIHFLVNEIGLVLDVPAESESVIWKPMDTESGVEVVRALN